MLSQLYDNMLISYFISMTLFCIKIEKEACNMSEVRKDSKGRKLWQGEIQRKDGKYRKR